MKPRPGGRGGRYLDVERAHGGPVHAVVELQAHVAVTGRELLGQEPGRLTGVATGLCVDVVTCTTTESTVRNLAVWPAWLLASVYT